MPINEFFDRVVVLTTSRKERCERELAKWGIQVQYFKSLSYKPQKSFNLSMRTIIEQFHYSKDQSLLILEDDVVFQNMEQLDATLDELEQLDWDVFYMGGNYKNHEDAQQPEYVSPHIRRIYNAWTTHAIAFRRQAAQWILDEYKADHYFDAWLDNKLLSDVNAYASFPLLAIQENSYSDLWGREVDYTDVWNRSTDFIR